MKLKLKAIEIKSFVSTLAGEEIKGGALAAGGAVALPRDETIPPYCPSGDENCR